MKWMAEDFSAIKKLARQEGAEIFFGDEASVKSDYHSGTTWAPRGQIAILETTGTTHKVNLISAIIPRGAVRFMATEGSFTSSVFIESLRRLINKAKRPIFLIVDNHSVHRSTELHEFVQSTKANYVYSFRG